MKGGGIGIWALVLVVICLFLGSPASRGQEVIDQIAARVESDVILLSEVRELSRYQLLLDGKTEPDDLLLDRLIDQWIVRTEAEASRFPEPSEEEIKRGMERLEKSFASPEEFDARMKQSGLRDSEVRQMMTSQLFLGDYLDSRFRPSVQVDDKAIEDFYQNALIPRAKARGDAPPTLEDSRDSIREALIQSGITEQAERWLKESRSRLHIEKLLGTAQK